MFAFNPDSSGLCQTIFSFPQQRLMQSSRIAQKLAAYLKRSLSCLMREPQLFMMRKLARFEIVRQVYEGFGSARPTAGATLSCSVLEAIDVPAAVAQIKRDGCYPGLQLSAKTVQQILEFAATEPCYANRAADLPFQIGNQAAVAARLASSGQSLVMASYLGNHESCPAIQQLLTDPGLLAIAEQYFGRTPLYVSSELMWSFPTPTTLEQQLQTAQVFHCDIDDYSCVKVFFYLTDVDELSGPHIYLRTSHRNKSLLHQILGKRCASIPDPKLVEHYGPENVMPLCGPAGYGFIEDIFGFHKGRPPQTRNRLLLQIEFATNTYKNLRSCEW